MKLLIQIPCYNEAQTLGAVLSELPKLIPGISKIEVVVIDDGSSDNTAQIAGSYQAIVLRHIKNQGLASAFVTGLNYALKTQADILVNTDGDNQYPAEYLVKLIKPILNKKAHLVIGNRFPWENKEFSLIKRLLHFFGSLTINKLTGRVIPDPVSGFRAYSRESLYQLNISEDYTYTLDSLIQLSKKNIIIKSVPIKTNNKTRNSRLFSNIFQYIYRSIKSIVRLYVIYEPFKTFILLSSLFAIPSAILIMRFFYFFFTIDGQTGHTQSLIVASILIIISVVLFALGILGALQKRNRELLEEQLTNLKKLRYEK